MDSNVGLDYIVDNPDYCAKLASALDTACTSVKKQVVDLLSALCVYSQDGRQRAIDALNIYQERKGERYRLRVVVDELQKATAEDYQTALVAFVNCLVISTPILKDRVRLRNEFIGLKLLPVLNELRKSDAPDLRVQLDVFDDQRDADEESSNQGPPGIDLSSHVEVFYAILGQIADTPQEIPFLCILQHLLRLDPKEPASDLAWDTAETLVHRATLLENREDATKLLRSPSLQTNLCCHCRAADQTCGTPRRASLPAQSGNPTPPVVVVPPPPPPTPPTPPCSALPAPPPPPPLFNNVSAISNVAMEPPLPPPLRVPPIARVPTPEPPSNNGNGNGKGNGTGNANAKLLPQQEIPTPKTKMKTINWNKIPNHKVIGKKNIWALVANEHQNSPMADLDWAEMEGLFCQQIPPMLPPTACSSSSYCSGLDATDRRRKEPTEIALLDGKRSLNVNIFLKQFRSSNEDIIQLIREGGHDDIGAEKLRGLLKILPEVDELEMLKSFDGDKSKLGNAEKFFLQLIQVPNYKLRIECMLLKEEFAANMSYLEPSINSMILAGEDLMTNKSLQEVLYMVLVAGNFLNSGGYAGNAAGVKLSSLQKLTEIRANKPGMNLIHYVALQAERKRKDLLNFARGMTTLEGATKTTIEQLNNEFNSLDSKIKKIKSQIQLATTENDIQEQMAQFLQMAEREMEQLKRDLEELEGVRRSLGEFFCEDANTFKLEECYRVFHQFCQKFNQAVAENERRRIQEEQVIARRKQREEQLLARKRLLNNQAETPGSESECNLLDYGLFDLGFSQRASYRGDTKVKRLQNGVSPVTGVTSDEDISVSGSPSIRRRLGSCSGGQDQQSTKEETYSPDVTPNGTLRRRRSRIPVEDDDGNLMDFLRTSGQDNARERKSWGSLDRSWARRARGQPRRGDLLNADFSGDRERPSSPSPLLENKRFLQEEAEETKPTGKAWRQKIEAWLSENEKEERAGEELQRKARQLQANRRSFEDSESEGKSSSAVNTLTEDSGHEGRFGSEVYDWRPSVEKTDVMRTMEAIEEVQPQSLQKDKSPWRKSSLNVPNCMEESDPRYSRRLRSRLSSDNIHGSSLQAIREEERKKKKHNNNNNNKVSELNNEGQDELTIYLRQPTIVPTTTTATATATPQSVPPPTSAVRRLSKFGKKSSSSLELEDKISDKIEIDSDNIETPPATRRMFGPPKEVRPVEKEPCKRERCSSSLQSRESKANGASGDLGIGNFDRYSVARRTRRYKKSQDQEKSAEAKSPMENNDNDNENANANVSANDENENDRDYDEEGDGSDGSDGSDGRPQRPKTLSLSKRKSIDQEEIPAEDSGDSMLKVWQDKLKRRESHHHRPSNDIESALAEIARSGEDLQRLSRSSGSHRRNSRLPVSSQSSVPPPVIAVTNTVLSPVMQESRPREASTVVAERAVSSRERHRSMIDPSQVKEAVRLTSSPPSQVSHHRDRSKEEKQAFKNRLIPDISVVTTTGGCKAKDQELNDEGFEETQSLVSETLSQETSSGNYETDAHDSASRGSPSSSEQRTAADEASGSLRLQKSSFLPKSTGSPRREGARKQNESAKKNAGLSRNEVERSGSRTSLRSSSRSSLNSATSVNTVRNLPPPLPPPPSSSSHAHLGSYTSAICALTSDLRKTGATAAASSSSSSSSRNPPMSSIHSKAPDNKRRGSNPKAPGNVNSKIPASRNSSVGTAATATAKGIRRTPSTVINEIQKGNVASKYQGIGPRGSVVSSRSSSSGSSVGQQPSSNLLGNRRRSNERIASSNNALKSRLMYPKVGTARGSNNGQNFMRPTTASVNKGSNPNLPKSMKNLVDK